MNKFYNCSLRGKPVRGGRLLVSFYNFTRSGKNDLRAGLREIVLDFR